MVNSWAKGMNESLIDYILKNWLEARSCWELRLVEPRIRTSNLVIFRL